MRLGTDAFMDAVLSFTTLIAAIISLVWHLSIEGYLGFIISIIIIKSSIDILKDTVNSMIGSRADSELTKKLRSRIMEFKDVQGVYDLSLHDYGPSNIMGAVHIQVRDELTAKELHKITREIVFTIYQEFGIVLTIGVYAANDNGEYGDIKKELVLIVNNYMEILQIHGFYVDEETKTISFDLIVDFKADSPEETKNIILDQIKEKYPNYNYSVILDTDVSD